VGFVVDKVVLGRVFSEYFGFPCQSSFNQILYHHNHPGQATIGQSVAAVPSGQSWTPPPTKRIKKKVRGHCFATIFWNQLSLYSQNKADVSGIQRGLALRFPDSYSRNSPFESRLVHHLHWLIFLQSAQANTETLRRLGHVSFLPNPFWFINLMIWGNIVWACDSVVKYSTDRSRGILCFLCYLFKFWNKQIFYEQRMNIKASDISEMEGTGLWNILSRDRVTINGFRIDGRIYWTLW
jgi:hypothetical protein